MRERKAHKIEVHVAGYCFGKNNDVLLAKRSPGRKFYPNLWEGGGGQVQKGENFDEAIARQMREEFGVEVELVKAFETYEIPVPESQQKKIPGLRYVCKFMKYTNGREPRISEEHSEWRWQNIERLGELELIPGLREDIKKARKIINCV